MRAKLQEALDLDRQGQDDEALSLYLAYLNEHPDDFDALIHLGALISRKGYFRAAMAAYVKAAQLRPTDPQMRTMLGNMLLSAGQEDAARVQFEAALATDPDFAPAHTGLGGVYGLLGDEASSRYHLDLGFRGNALTHVPYRGTGSPLRVLVLESAASGNFNPRWLIDSHCFEVFRIATEYFDSEAPLPAHDVIVNIIGDADLCQDALEAASRIIGRSDIRAVINDPASVALTGRITNAERLRGVRGLRVPRIAAVYRENLLREGQGALADRGFSFPLLLRSPGHHTGRHFVKVDGASELEAALVGLPGDPLLVIESVDLSQPDGFTRKYRMVSVDGSLFPVHAAISRDWKIHFFGTSEEAVHLEEDRRFLEDPHSILSPPHFETLREIVRTMALDYVGVDFGVDSSGRLVLFEANATMSIHLIDPGSPDDHRSGPLMRIFDAFGRMIKTRSGTLRP